MYGNINGADTYPSGCSSLPCCHTDVARENLPQGCKYAPKMFKLLFVYERRVRLLLLFYVLLRNDANRAQDLQRFLQSFFNVGLGLNHLGKGADFPSFFLHVDPNLSGRKKKTAVTGLSLECRKIKS